MARRMVIRLKKINQTIRVKHEKGDDQTRKVEGENFPKEALKRNSTEWKSSYAITRKKKMKKKKKQKKW